MYCPRGLVQFCQAWNVQAILLSRKFAIGVHLGEGLGFGVKGWLGIEGWGVGLLDKELGV